MADPMTCFACDQEPTQQCARCGRPYCDDHGDELCDACLEPASGVPSFTLYRGSLMVLLIGTALAVWLLVQPGSDSEGALRPVVFTPTSAAAVEETATPAVETTPDTDATQPAAGDETPETEPTSESGPASGTYVVQSGDTLSAICAQLRPEQELDQCIDEVVALNGLDSPESLVVGQELIIPE